MTQSDWTEAFELEVKIRGLMELLDKRRLAMSKRIGLDKFPLLFLLDQDEALLADLKGQLWRLESKEPFKDETEVSPY